MPNSRLIAANQMMPAEYAAAIAVPEILYIKIAESMKFMSVHDSVVTTMGRAIFRTSRPPAGRDHQDSGSSALPFDIELTFESKSLGAPENALPRRTQRSQRRVKRDGDCSLPHFLCDLCVLC